MQRSRSTVQLDPAKVRYWTAERDLTQREVAERMGICETTLSAAVRGRRTLRTDRLLALARILRVPYFALCVTEAKVA